MGKTPKAPDPKQQAEAANSQSMWAAMANSVMGNADTVNPYGSTRSRITDYVDYKDPYTGRVSKIPRWEQTTQLDPTQQRLFDTENRVKQGMGGLAEQQIGKLTDVLGRPFSQEGLQEWGTYGAGPTMAQETGPTDRAAIEKAIMESHTRGQQPVRSAEDAQMAARGMGAPGSKYGYSTTQARGDVDTEAGRQAYLASGGESRAAMEAQNKARQQQWLNENARTDQGNALRQNQFQMNQAERNQWVNEVAALMGGGQATVPQATPWQGGQVNPFDIAGAQNNAYNIKSQQSANKMTGMFGLAGNVLGTMFGGPVGGYLGGLGGKMLGGLGGK